MAVPFLFRKPRPISPVPLAVPAPVGTMRVGLGQLLVEGGEPARNLARAVEQIAQAAAQKCDLVLLPETLDFAWTHPSALYEAQPIPGAYSELLCQAAAQHGIYVCAGLTERGPDGRNFNAALLIDPQGNIIVKYHKINLLNIEQPFYAVGQTLNVVDTPLGKIGVNICADNYLDGLSIGHTLARMGAEFILAPSSWTVDYSLTEEHDPYEEKWVRPFSILARLYNVVVVSTTSVGYIVGGPYEGKKSVGCSLAVDANGVQARGAFNEFAGQLVVADLARPHRAEKGTDIGLMLQRKGYRFDELL
ncbi:MAG: hypothetical protein JWR44_1410 [Hymenobacter sp.]|jgi:predicted amidohydrolase|nr:hypothetical protein [Hymenobacter sp.]